MLVITGCADAGAFLARLVRLDPLAVVRLRSDTQGSARLWARLPFGVLVTRRVAAVASDGSGSGSGSGVGVGVGVDLTVAADALLARLGRAASVAGSAGVPTVDLPRRDGDWRWSLPPVAGQVVETVPAARVAQIARAAGRVLRNVEGDGVAGRAVGARAVRDALLNHVPIVVTRGDTELGVPQRLVQGLTRMGFLSLTDHEATVTISFSDSWVGLAGTYGAAWHLPVSPLRVL